MKKIAENHLKLQSRQNALLPLIKICQNVLTNNLSKVFYCPRYFENHTIEISQNVLFPNCAISKVRHYVLLPRLKWKLITLVIFKTYYFHMLLKYKLSLF